MKLSQKLKNDTKNLHDDLERILNSQKIFSENFTQCDLSRILSVLYKFHSDVENSVFRNISADDFPSVKDRSRIEVLKKDLSILNNEKSAEIEPREISLNKFEALGWLYVIEGSSLGGNVIMKHLRQQKNFENFPFNYYSAFTENIGQFWKAFCEKIDAQPEEKYAEILRGAQSAYAELINHAKQH